MRKRIELIKEVWGMSPGSSFYVEEAYCDGVLTMETDASKPMYFYNTEFKYVEDIPSVSR